MKGTREQDLKVFISSRDSTCDECGEHLGTRAWITLTPDSRAICLDCSDLSHLLFLPSGDAALTRRSRAHSRLTAVVLKWSRARKRYERQGLLAEENAIDRAEQECLADEEARTRRREREALRRTQLDAAYVRSFADQVRRLYPWCPPGREVVIAEHACLKYSGRVGRSASARELDEEAIRLAVAAHIRHTETNYDELLGQGMDRRAARIAVEAKVLETLSRWRSNVQEVPETG